MSGSMGVAITDKIAKQRLNVIMLVDCSSSMRGERIAQVNEAIRDIKKYLTEMQSENTNVDFYITVITYSTDAFFLNRDKCKPIEEFDFKDIKGGGWSNLHIAYERLADILKKESQGGIMPDYGGVAPIILLNIEDARFRKKAAEEKALTLENIYKILIHFSELYDIMNDEERKELFAELIQEIQIYPEGESDCPLKSIKFNFPVFQNGKETEEVFLNKPLNVETLVVLSHKKPDSHLEVKIDSDNTLPDKTAIAERSGKRKPQGKTTYKNM